MEVIRWNGLQAENSKRGTPIHYPRGYRRVPFRLRFLVKKKFISFIDTVFSLGKAIQQPRLNIDTGEFTK